MLCRISLPCNFGALPYCSRPSGDRRWRFHEETQMSQSPASCWKQRIAKLLQRRRRRFASRGRATLAFIVLAMYPLHHAWAEQRQTFWRNASSDNYTVVRNSYSGCVTDAGPASFTVVPGRIVGAQLTVGGDCQAFVEWRITQRRVTGQVDVRLQYTETPDGDGLSASVVVIPDKLPEGKLGHYFQAQCGPSSGVAISCLGRSVALPQPTRNTIIAFNVFKLPIEDWWCFFFMHPIWQPMW